MRKFLIFIFCFLFFVPHFSFASDGDSSSGKTIIEAIETLSSDASDVKQKLNDYFQANTGLQWFMKLDLAQEDLEDISQKLDNFLNQKSLLKSKLDDAIKNGDDAKSVKDEWIKLQLDFYKQLIPYLQVSKLQDFLAYIKNSLSDSLQDQEIRTNIDILREKIEQNKKLLDEKIRAAVQDRIEQKILEITENPDFKKLPIQSKITIFKKVLEKVKEREVELSKIKEKTTILKKKIELFQLFESKVAEFIDKLEK